MSHSDIDCLGGGLCSPSAVLVDVLIVQAIRDPCERARKLREILEGRDDNLLPVFWQVLVDTGQLHEAYLLGFQGSSVACSVNSTLVLFSDQQNLCYYFCVCLNFVLFCEIHQSSNVL